MPGPGRNRILIWMCVLIAVNQLGFGSIVPVIALYARSFGVLQSAIGLAVGIYGLARFLVALPAGQLADRIGRRSVLALGGLVTAAGNLLCGYAPDFPTFVVARFVSGAGAALVVTTGTIVLADITSPLERGRVMSVYQGTFLFAVGVGPLPGGLLAERYGLGAPFLFYAAAGTLAAALAFFYVPETRDLPGARAAAAVPGAAPVSFAAQLRLLVGQVGFALLGLTAFMGAVARTGGLFSVIPILARDRLGLSADRIGFGLAVASIVGLAFAYPAGVLVDRYGRKTVIVPASVMSGVSLIVFLVAPSYAWFLAGCVAWSVAAGIGGAAPAAYAADVAPPGMNAAAMSAYRMVGDLGYVVGPVALGIATDLAGADATLATTAALVVLVAVLFARFAPETYRRV
jgi:MFS family permease